VRVPYELHTSASQVHTAIFNKPQQLTMLQISHANLCASPSCLSDYRPVGLIYVAMKALEHSLITLTLYTTGGGKHLCLWDNQRLKLFASVEQKAIFFSQIAPMLSPMLQNDEFHMLARD